MHIAVVGTGYVGLVTGTCFAEFGVDVTCVDNDQRKIEMLGRGEIPIYEPGLEDLVRKNSAEGRLHFSTDVEDAVRKSLVVFIAVGTPPRPDGSADLSYVEEVARIIAGCLNGYKVVVTKSTVPIGTGERIRRIIESHRVSDCRFDVASNPEFLREGSAIEDFLRPNRVVIGAESEEAVAILKDLYSPLYLIETPFVITSVPSAEMIKYASNAFLAVKISFINEIAEICERVGADVHHVAKGMGLDQRIGGKFLHPGPGFGGSCFPKDTQALVQIAREHGYDLLTVRAAMEVNRERPGAMLAKVRELLPDVAGRTVGILGLSFKPNTDDMREAPSLPIIRDLASRGACLRVYDPVAMEAAKSYLADLPELLWAGDAYDAATGADLLILVTEWNQFRKLDLEKLKSAMKSPRMVDCRNVYDPASMAAVGFRYLAVGRPHGHR
jgi:UDPglucose 6-dehydrogenase